MYQQDYENQYYQEQEKSSLANFNPRLGFVKKVYGILSVQLIITGIFVYLSLYHIKQFYTTPAAFGIAIACAVTTFIVSILICCYTSIARSVPTNYYLLGLFTVCEAYLVGLSTSHFPPQTVMLAGALTISLTLTLTLYACTTKTDFTVCGGFLFVLAWGLFLFSAIFVYGFFSGKMNAFTFYAINIAAVMIYGFYLIYDTQLIMGGGKFQLTLDDYVLGAMVIYIDIIIIFLKILRMFGERR